MDSDYVDPRIFMYKCDNTADKRISLRNDDRGDIANRRMSIRNSFNCQMEPAAPSYHSQVSRSISINHELREPPQMDWSHLEPEVVPLQRKPSAKFKQKNHTKHSCTDIHCLIIFVCFVAAWIFIAGYALSKGDLDKVLIPTDSNNAKCGLDSGVRDKTKLFFFNLDKCLDPLVALTGCETKQICVNECPKSSFFWEDSPQHMNNLENLICDSNVDKNQLKSISDITEAIKNDRCSGWYMKSKSLFNHCVWDFSKDVCNILPNVLTSRKRRSNWVPEIQTKVSEILDGIKSMCKDQNSNSTAKVIAIQQKLEQSNSNFNRIIAAIISKFNFSNKDYLSENIALDLKNSWKVILFAIVIHLIAVLIFITLLRWMAGPMLWISVCGVILGLGFSFVYSFKQYKYWNSEPHVPNHGVSLKAKFQNIIEDENVWLYITILLGAVFTIILLIVVVLRKRIKIAVGIIKEASRAITSIKSSIFFPIFPAILYILVAILSLIIMLYLSSIGNFSFKIVRRNPNTTENCVCNGSLISPTYKLGDSCEPALFEKHCHIEGQFKTACIEYSCSFNEIVKSPKTQWFMFFNIFGFIWVTFFLSAYEDMVLACTFSMWYWTFNKKNIPKSPLLKAIWITTFYHLGTVAFGSLVLTICRMIRYMLEFIEKKAKLYNNPLTRAILCCMKCFFWLLENFIRFLNRNAYITCAIHSTSFCASSRKAFNLITQNILRVYAIDKVSNFLFFLSKLLVTGCTSAVTYYVLKNFPNAIKIHYPEVPVALVAIVAYVMAHLIFSTYSMAVDTLFFCFLEDSTENDGSAEKPFYMSKELNKLLKKSKRNSKQIQK